MSKGFIDWLEIILFCFGKTGSSCESKTTAEDDADESRSDELVVL